jgi:hypothetical protein
MRLEELPERDMFGGRPGEYVIPLRAMSTFCASCGARVVWITTGSGKRMPLALDTEEERDGIRYALPHWIDCKDANTWRKA